MALDGVIVILEALIAIRDPRTRYSGPLIETIGPHTWIQLPKMWVSFYVKYKSNVRSICSSITFLKCTLFTMPQEYTVHYATDVHCSPCQKGTPLTMPEQYLVLN